MNFVLLMSMQIDHTHLTIFQSGCFTGCSDKTYIYLLLRGWVVLCC
jgi:hypothetical protein